VDNFKETGLGTIMSHLENISGRRDSRLISILLLQEVDHEVHKTGKTTAFYFDYLEER
jgi:hypothetical protein